MNIKIAYDDTLIEEIAARFDLSDPNKRALQAVVKAVVAANGTSPRSSPISPQVSARRFSCLR